MITFEDGPAAGAVLDLRRAPVFLRVVIDRATNEVDALDQLDDLPALGEDVHVYRRIGKAETYHIKCARRSESGFRSRAKYQLHDEQPADHVGRSRKSWEDWAMFQWEKENSI